jgi:hypothetical protein
MLSPSDGCELQVTTSIFTVSTLIHRESGAKNAMVTQLTRASIKNRPRFLCVPNLQTALALALLVHQVQLVTYRQPHFCDVLRPLQGRAGRVSAILWVGQAFELSLSAAWL